MDQHERKTIIDPPAAIDDELEATADVARAVELGREWRVLSTTLDAVHKEDDAG
jgi:hypothetical protein